MTLFGTLLLLVILFSEHQPVTSVKVFDFEGTFAAENDENLAIATLSNDLQEDLVGRFAICASFKVGKHDYSSVYHVFDHNDENWMMFTVYDNSIFGDFGPKPNSYQLIQIDIRPDTWYHFCLDIDLDNQNITFAINGDITETLDNVFGITEGKPNKIVIGRNGQEQFRWQLSNLHIFSSSFSASVLEISGNLCNFSGDLLAWNKMTWEKTGDWTHVTETDEKQDRVCDNKTTYDIPLNIDIYQDEGLKLCHKLGKGTMPVFSDTEQLGAFVDWFVEETTELDSSCWNIWTPYSDEETEGVYLSLEDKSRTTFLPWTENEGLKEDTNANSLVIVIPDSPTPYADVENEVYNCIACTLSTSLTVRLQGLCPGSILGDHNFLSKACL